MHGCSVSGLDSAMLHHASTCSQIYDDQGMSSVPCAGCQVCQMKCKIEQASCQMGGAHLEHNIWGAGIPPCQFSAISKDAAQAQAPAPTADRLQ